MAAFNGSGTYVRSYDWTDDAAGAVKIRADRMDVEMDGFATALSNCVTRDGQSPATANLPMGGFLHTGVGNATARTNYPAVGQIQDGSVIYAGTAGGTADVITVTLAPAITAYATGMIIAFKANGTNTTGVTVNVNSVGAKDLYYKGAALVSGDLNAGDMIIAEYDGTRLQMLTPPRVSFHQPLDADLTALAALASTGIVARTGSATYGLRTITGTANRITVSNGDGVSGNPTLDLSLAAASDLNTGTDANKPVTSDALAGSNLGIRLAGVQVFAVSTTCVTGDGKAWITIPPALNGMNLVFAAASVAVAGTTSAMLIQLRRVRTAVNADMLSSRISVGSAAVYSGTATIDTSNDDVQTADLIFIDVDQLHTTPATGLQIVLGFQLP